MTDQGTKEPTDFYAYYLAEYRNPHTRLFHVIGSTGCIAMTVAAFVIPNYRLIPAGVFVAYAFAWLSHFFVEKNRPATFKHPILSLVSDFRMFSKSFLAAVNSKKMTRRRHSSGTGDIFWHANSVTQMSNPQEPMFESLRYRYGKLT